MSNPSASRDAHIAMLRGGIEAFNRGDEATLLESFDPKIECRVGSGLMNTGTWRGLDGYRAMVEAWGEAWKEQEQRVGSVTAPDEHHVIAEIHQRAVGAVSSIPVEMTIYFLIEVRNGRIVRFHLYADRESARAAIR